MGKAGIGRRFDEVYRCDLEMHDILKGMSGSWCRCDRKRCRQDMLELRRGQRHECALEKVASMDGSCPALFIQPLLFGSFAFDMYFWIQSCIPLPNRRTQTPSAGRIESTVVHYCQAAEEPCYMFFVRQYLPLSSLSLPALAIQMTATKERIETIRKETSTGGSTEGSTGRQFEESTFRVHPSTRSYHLLICSIPPQPHQFRSAIMPNIIQKRLLLNN